MDSFDNITRVEKNAPDKIYFPAEGLPSYIDWDGSPIRTKQVEDSDICYIRKDALLEWARELNETYHKEYEISKYTCGEHWGQMVAFQKVIDKLNSM